MTTYVPPKPDSAAMGRQELIVELQAREGYWLDQLWKLRIETLRQMLNDISELDVP